jgi:hypothetical protein
MTLARTHSTGPVKSASTKWKPPRARTPVTRNFRGRGMASFQPLHSGILLGRMHSACGTISRRYRRVSLERQGSFCQIIVPSRAVGKEIWTN